MFQINENNTIIAFVDSLNFIRKSDAGCFIIAEENTAQGIVLNGSPCNLLGREVMDESLPTVWYSKINSGEYIMNQQTAIDEMILTILEG